MHFQWTTDVSDCQCQPVSLIQDPWTDLVKVTLSCLSELSHHHWSNCYSKQKQKMFSNQSMCLYDLICFCAICNFYSKISLSPFVAISNWQTHTMSTRHRTAERDFIALNREGVKSGLVTAKELHQYRATHDIRRQPATREAFCRSAPPRITSDASFGVSNRWVGGGVYKSPVF